MDRDISIIVVMGFISYLTRGILLILDFNMTDNCKVLMSYIPYSILSALIFPCILVHNNELNFSIDNHYLLAGTLSVFIAAISKKAILSIILGVAVLIFMKAITWE